MFMCNMWWNCPIPGPWRILPREREGRRRCVSRDVLARICTKTTQSFLMPINWDWWWWHVYTCMRLDLTWALWRRRQSKGRAGQWPSQSPTGPSTAPLDTPPAHGIETEENIERCWPARGPRWRGGWWGCWWCGRCRPGRPPRSPEPVGVSSGESPRPSAAPTKSPGIIKKYKLGFEAIFSIRESVSFLSDHDLI